MRRNDNVLGNERLGMSDIMRKLSQKAYLEYDGALRIYMQACLVKAAALTKASALPSEASLPVDNAQPLLAQGGLGGSSC